MYEPNVVKLNKKGNVRIK